MKHNVEMGKEKKRRRPASNLMMMTKKGAQTFPCNWKLKVRRKSGWLVLVRLGAG